MFDRFLAGAEEGGETHFGVHISYEDLYHSVVFLASIYVAGILAAKVLKMPALVGEIFCGILFGPNLLNFVPNAESFVMLGEVGLILLVLEAGIDIDLTTLRLVGTRGVAIAFVGTFLPVILASVIVMALGYRGIEAVAAACSFAPTSLGIAMNVLRQSGLSNTPVCQLIIAAAIIDDMIALVILSQLEAFTGDNISVVDMAVPIISALLFLFVGGYLAIFVVPRFLNEQVMATAEKYSGFQKDWLAMCIMFAMLLALIPATYYGKASPLMGAFLAGLAFCSNAGAHHMFAKQFKRVMQWLLRIFFAASIGFQVPIRKFASGTVLLQGFVLTLALLGKIAVGFMTPNMSKSHHIRDCLVVGFSMAAEGEFAFVIAAFAVSNHMVSIDLYAAIVLAVLLSTIVAPFCLRKSIHYFQHQMEEEIKNLPCEEKALEDGVRNNTAVFLCVQITSAPAWGLQSDLMEAFGSLGLDVIDHRSWHPRQSSDLVINEIYARDISDALANHDKLSGDTVLNRIEDITKDLRRILGQEDAGVLVQRWYPDSLLAQSAPIDTSAIVKATSQALAASMRRSMHHESSGDYNQMESIEIKAKEEKLGWEGKLDGLIRHDRPQVTTLADESSDDSTFDEGSKASSDENFELEDLATHRRA